MSYDVVVAELLAAAARYRSAADEVACYHLSLGPAGPDSLGHVELAAWLTAVAGQCDQAGRALHDGALGLAGSLEAAAAGYAATDQCVATGFQRPLGGLGWGAR